MHLCDTLIDLKSLCYDGYLAVLRKAHDVHRHAAAAEKREMALGWLREKDLRDGVAAGEVDQSFGGVLAFEHAGFNVQSTGEFEMLFEGDGIGRGHDADGETIGLEIIGDAAAAAEEAG